MEQLIKQIEQWAEDRNIINGSKPIDQAMKLFSEFGELADNVGKGRDCRDDIGDIFVVLTIIAKQWRETLRMIDFDFNTTHINNFDVCMRDIDEYGIKQFIVELGLHLTGLFSDDVLLQEPFVSDAEVICTELAAVAKHFGYTLEECVQIAYNDIKNRKGVMYNGVFIKESDPAHEDALLNLEADKRQGQKRVSVNLEDL